MHAAADAMFSPDAPHGTTLALMVRQGGITMYERYGAQPDTVFGPGTPVTADTTLISWSMAKSITHALVGLLVGEGRLTLDAPAPVAAWRTTEKEAITLQHLLTMTSGLRFVEDYVDDSVSHCIDMLFGAGKDDVASYAAALPLDHTPGTVWNYSSGTTNIICRIVGDAVGGGREGMERFMRERLFLPAGMQSATANFDEAGTFIGSSFAFATARDYARFGELYLRDGIAESGDRVLPTGWRDHARRFTATDPTHEGEYGGSAYGAQWWLWQQFPGALACQGYEGQVTFVWPEHDLVVVHLGKVVAPNGRLLDQQLSSVIRACV